MSCASAIAYTIPPETVVEMGGTLPNARAERDAVKVLAQLAASGVEPDEVTPAGDAGVCIAWPRDTWYAEFTVLNEGWSFVQVRDPRDQPARPVVLVDHVVPLPIIRQIRDLLPRD